MKKILLLLLLSLIFGQTDNIGSEAFNLTADHLFHSGRDKAFSDGTILFKSSSNRVDVDSSALWISDSTAGTRASGMFLLQEGDTIYSSATDLNLLSGFTDLGYTIIIDSSGYLLDVPRTVYGWGHDLTFSATDYNTIAWTSGDLYFANLDTFEIVSGNTGDISDPTWIYFDEDVSSTILQTTPEAGNSVGLGRIIVCIGEDVASPKKAVFQVFGGVGNGVFIVADNIAANTITGNEILANTITTNEIFFGSMTDSILYVINASSEGLHITGDRINITGATTFATGYNPVDGSVVLYQISAPATRPSGDPLQNGDSWVDTTAAQGNVPKVWTGSEWRTAFTYINGGYIKTGVLDVDRINAIASSGSGQRIVIDPATDRLYFYNAAGEVMRIGEDVLGSIDGIKVADGIFYASTNSATAYSNLHIEKYGQSGAGIQGLQTLYLSNDASASPTANPTNAWVVSKIEGERNSSNDIYGILERVINSGSGTVYGLKTILVSAGTVYGIHVTTFGANNTYGVFALPGAIDGNVYGIYGHANGGFTSINYGIYGKASGGTTNWAGYFSDGNVKIENNLIIDGNVDGRDINSWLGQSVATGASPTFITINTGEGANELFDMNQNVETGNSPTFAGLTLNPNGVLAIEEKPNAPTHVAGYGKLWVKNDTSTPLRYTTDDDQDLYVVTAIARTTLPGTTWEGRIVIDTDDNIAYIYADSGWRIIASGW